MFSEYYRFAVKCKRTIVRMRARSAPACSTWISPALRRSFQTAPGSTRTRCRKFAGAEGFRHIIIGACNSKPANGIRLFKKQQ